MILAVSNHMNVALAMTDHLAIASKAPEIEGDTGPLPQAANPYVLWTSILAFLFVLSLIISAHPDSDYLDGFMAWEDANLYFNRTNNLKAGFEFFIYAGYISFAPQILTYIYSYLPYVLQSFCYAMTALLVGLWMFYQFTAILIDVGARPRLAFAVALVAVAYLHIVCQEFYLNLTFSIWSGLIGASIYVMRISLAGAKPYWLSTTLAAASFASHPLAIASLPVLGAGLFWGRGRLVRLIPHAVVLVLGILLVAFFTEASRNAASLSTMPEALWKYLVSLPQVDAYLFVTAYLPLFVALAGISAGLVRLPGLIKSGAASAAAVLFGSLFLVAVYLVLYLASGRSAGEISANGRYFTPPVAFTILALTVSFLRALWLVAFSQRLERLGRTPIHLFLTAWLVVSLVVGPATFWRLYGNRLRFLATAQCMRESGLDGIAIAAEEHEGTMALGNGHFKHASWDPGMADFEPSLERLAELQRVCPGLQPSYVQAVTKAHIWIGPRTF